VKGSGPEDACSSVCVAAEGVAINKTLSRARVQEQTGLIESLCMGIRAAAVHEARGPAKTAISSLVL